MIVNPLSEIVHIVVYRHHGPNWHFVGLAKSEELAEFLKKSLQGLHPDYLVLTFPLNPYEGFDAI